MNTNGNIYTVIYTTLVVVLVAAVLVYTVKTFIEKCSKGKACKSSERTACHEAEKAANPFSCCHILLFWE